MYMYNSQYIWKVHVRRPFIPQSRQSAKLFLKSSELGLPQPLTRRRVCPPPPGEGDTRWRERGWESHNSDEGTNTVVLFINTYFVVHSNFIPGSQAFFNIVHNVHLLDYLQSAGSSIRASYALRSSYVTSSEVA
jgi:hypothetical protein